VLRVTDPAGSFGLQSFDLEVVRVPVDPVLVAPPIDLTVATSVYEANRFLLEGSNPIQTALSGAVNPRRALLLRGRALLADETPVVGALVSVPGQPDVGTTLTRLDGSFDLLVNGGGIVSVRLEKSGLISVDRSVDSVWQETYVFSDLVMTSPSPGVSIDFTAPGPKLIPSANVSGRRTTLFFGSNAAAFSASDASVLTTIRAHVSEFESGFLGAVASLERLLVHGRAPGGSSRRCGVRERRLCLPRRHPELARRARRASGILSP
jgi:hypothetical protein